MRPARSAASCHERLRNTAGRRSRLSPRIVTIWKGFCEYFDSRQVPTDYLLYSNYERLVEALLRGEVDVGWNTNTAYVAAEQRIGGDAVLLGVRDVDAD